MATVATMQAAHMRPAPVPIAPCPGARSRPSSSAKTSSQPHLNGASDAAKVGLQPSKPAICDGCKGRNSRCAMNEKVGKCYSCDFHRQDCVFTPVSSRKRSYDEASADGAQTQPVVPPLRVRQPPTWSKKVGDDQRAPINTTTVQAKAPDREEKRICRYIGGTTDLELSLLDTLPLQELASVTGDGCQIARFDRQTFMEILSTAHVGVDSRHRELESLVEPYQQTLVDSYIDSVQPSFPFLAAEDITCLRSNRAALDTHLLAAVYLFSAASKAILDLSVVTKLEDLSTSLLQDSFSRPQLSTIQAALIMAQIGRFGSPLLNMQINAASFDLALYQDCSAWGITPSHKALRRRLAWAVYGHDKWTALATGRPSLITQTNWTVLPLTPADFDATYSPVPSVELFTSYITLSTLLSSVLDTFYTLSSTAISMPQQILALAKPVQLELKNWYSQLPVCLKMDNPVTNPVSSNCSAASSPKSSSTTQNPSYALGFLHLSYFTTEILLHRRIIRSLSLTQQPSGYSPLQHICRLAAKTRLISSLDFLNRLHAPHLSSFWPCSYTCTQFAMIGSFGTLLLATSPTVEEEMFYKARLDELRWTLGVCSTAASLSLASRRSSLGSQGKANGVISGQVQEDQLGFQDALWKLDMGLEMWEKSRAAAGSMKMSAKIIGEQLKQAQVTIAPKSTAGQAERTRPFGLADVTRTNIMLDGLAHEMDEMSELEEEDSEDESED